MGERLWNIGKKAVSDKRNMGIDDIHASLLSVCPGRGDGWKACI